MIFSIADSKTTSELAERTLDKGMWVVDLTREAKLDPKITPNLFHPIADMKDLLTTATITSTAIPVAFPPVKWSIVHKSTDDHDQILKHVCVDGGVLDNTPIDIAMLAGATHIISIELDPILNPLYDKDVDFEDTKYNLATVGLSSFMTSMDASLLNRIGMVVDKNKEKLQNSQQKGIVQIYRLAPLIKRDKNNKKTSIGVIDFNGAYDSTTHHLIMSLYDWYMQGYIDALGLEENNTANNAIYRDYRANARALRCTLNHKFLGNKFWVT